MTTSRMRSLATLTAAAAVVLLAVDGQGLHLRTLGQRQRVRSSSARAQPQA